MRPKRVMIGTIVTACAAALAMLSPSVRGASLAAVDLVRGKSTVYQLGCVIGPATDAVGYRFEELLAERYRLRCETTGGFAPSDTIVRFTTAYNFVTLRAAQVRYGADFWQRTQAEAERDVSERTAVFEGCFAPRAGELLLASGQRIVVLPSLTFDEPEWLNEAGELVPVRVTGTFTSVRVGKWNEEVGPQVRPSKMEHLQYLPCRTVPRPVA
jgi:hypothetical protein